MMQQSHCATLHSPSSIVHFLSSSQGQTVFAVHCKRGRKETRGGGRGVNLYEDRRSGHGDGEAVSCRRRGLLHRGMEGWKKSVRGVLWYSQQPLPYGGPQRAHPLAPPSLATDRLPGRRRVTGLGNEPGEQPVGGDDGWMSHQVYSCDTRTLKHTLRK